jgi:hypothetical protein
MNWQAVIDNLRLDVKVLQSAQLKVPKSDVAAIAMCGTGAVILAKLADALQMGLNKTARPPLMPPS